MSELFKGILKTRPEWSLFACVSVCVWVCVCVYVWLIYMSQWAGWQAHHLGWMRVLLSRRKLLSGHSLLGFDPFPNPAHPADHWQHWLRSRGSLAQQERSSHRQRRNANTTVNNRTFLLGLLSGLGALVCDRQTASLNKEDSTSSQVLRTAVTNWCPNFWTGLSQSE